MSVFKIQLTYYKRFGFLREYYHFFFFFYTLNIKSDIHENFPKMTGTFKKKSNTCGVYKTDR